MTRSVLVLAFLSGCAAACGSGTPAQQALAAPKFAPADQSSCHVGASPTRPLIVEWPSTARGELEAIIEDHKNVAVVHYEGCTMTVLSGCKAPGTIAYVPYRNTKQDQLRITNADDLYANLPVGAASLEGKLQRSGELDIDMTLVGQYESDAPDVTRSDLAGTCEGATHLVKTVSVGAFDFHTGASAAAGGGVSALGAGAGGSTAASQDTLSRDGKVDACGGAKSGDTDPPANCGALVRVEVAPIPATLSGPRRLPVSVSFADQMDPNYVLVHAVLFQGGSAGREVFFEQRSPGFPKQAPLTSTKRTIDVAHDAIGVVLEYRSPRGRYAYEVKSALPFDPDDARKAGIGPLPPGRVLGIRVEGADRGDERTPREQRPYVRWVLTTLGPNGPVDQEVGGANRVSTTVNPSVDEPGI
jgi:hypothetical protein